MLSKFFLRLLKEIPFKSTAGEFCFVYILNSFAIFDANEFNFKKAGLKKSLFSNNKNRIKFSQSIVSHLCLMYMFFHRKHGITTKGNEFKKKTRTVLKTRSKWQRHWTHTPKKNRNGRPWQKHEKKQKANLIESKWANINAFVNISLSLCHSFAMSSVLNFKFEPRGVFLSLCAFFTGNFF